MKSLFTTCLVGIAILTKSLELHAQDQVLYPPWMTHTEHLLYLLYGVEPVEANKFLPDGIRAKINEQGMVTAGVELYTIDKSYGQGAGAVFIIFLEVEGYASRSGTPGHYMIWGAIQSKEAIENYKKVYGFPYGQESTMTQEIENGIYSGSAGPEGKEWIRYSGKPVQGDAYGMQSDVTLVSKIDGKLLVTNVPFINSGRQFQLDKFEFQSNEIPQLQLFDGKEPFLTYLVQDAWFSYSTPKNAEVN